MHTAAVFMEKKHAWLLWYAHFSQDEWNALYAITHTTGIVMIT